MTAPNIAKHSINIMNSANSEQSAMTGCYRTMCISKWLLQSYVTVSLVTLAYQQLVLAKNSEPSWRQISLLKVFSFGDMGKTDRQMDGLTDVRCGT